MIKGTTSITIPEHAVCCSDCGVPCSVSLQRFRNGQVRFRLECDDCGTFSHYLDVPRWLERAIEEYLENIGPKTTS